MTNQDIYQQFTDRIVAMLEAGELPPWCKPWKSDGPDGFVPRNVSSGRAYRGINVWWLLMAAAGKGYNRNLWLTFKQAKELAVETARRDGRNIEERRVKRGRFWKVTYWDADKDCPFLAGVRKGEKSETVILWKPAKGKDKTNENTGEKEKGRVYLLIRTYHVFNVEQCDGIELPKKFQLPEPGEDEGDDAEEIKVAIDERAEGVLTTYLERESLQIYHGGNRACYSSSEDQIRMPNRDDFDGSSGYYSTAFHECAHSTGHTSRLDRDCLRKVDLFGSHTYSREELVAEFAAAFLCGVTGTALVETTQNSASYLKTWAAKLKDDPKLLINAAAAAQKAADYVLDGPQEKEPQENGG